MINQTLLINHSPVWFISLVLLEFDVIRTTPKGGYIKLNPYTFGEKWIPFNAKKAYAYLSIKQARTNFIKRNQTRRKILNNQLDIVEKALKKVETFYKNNK